MTKWLALVGFLAACGDNSKLCGPGTTDEEGVCTPIGKCGAGTISDQGVCVPDGTILCTNGTKLVDGKCVIDPTACRDGTVLVGGKCVDPGVIDVDKEEGPEPNGFGVLGEASPNVAGTLTPVAGTPFVVHGHITPFRDLSGDGQLDSDIDAFRITITQPTLLTITVDGLHGAIGGFYAVAETISPLATWHRIGASFHGDTAKRQLLLPVAGNYLIAFSDARSIVLGNPAGSADAEYYATIELVALPTPTAADLDAGVTGTVGDSLLFYSSTTTAGPNRITLDMPLAAAQSSVLVLRGNTLVALADEGATATFTGTTGDPFTVVVDFVFDYALGPVAFDLARQ